MEGRLEISDFTLSCMEGSIIHSFEARRGKLFHALHALNAVALHEIAMNIMQPEGALAARPHPATRAYRNPRKLMLKTLQNQMEPEVYEQLAFLRSLRVARRLKGPLGIITRLEALTPPFVDEFLTREAKQELEPRVGFLHWCLRTNEVGRIEPLLEFARNTLFWTSDAFLKRKYGDLESRINALSFQLPR